MPEYLAGKEATAEQLNEWVESFHANGFLVIHNVLAPELCQHLKNDLDDILKITEGEKYNPSRGMMKKRMFEHSQHNLNLFALEPIVTFAEHLIGGANGAEYSMHDGIKNANTVHVIHNNSFIVPPDTDGLAKNKWHQDDTPHVLSLDGKPLTNIRLNVLAFTVNYYLTFCDGDISEYEDQVHSCLGAMGTAVCFNNQVWHRGSRNSSDVARYITQVTYAKRLVGHKYESCMNYQMPSHCYEEADDRLKRLLGFLPKGAYS